MSHLFFDQDRVNSKFDREYAARATDPLSSDCRLWNGSASNFTSEKHDASARSESNGERGRGQRLKKSVQPLAGF
jgi:hypothetical protein